MKRPCSKSRKTHVQYFVGLAGYQMQVPFVPSLFVEIRRRMGQDVFEVFHGAIVDAVEQKRAKSKASRSAGNASTRRRLISRWRKDSMGKPLA